MSAKKMDKELAVYSVAAGAVLAGGGSASADIQYTEVDLTVSEAFWIPVDLNEDGLNDLSLVRMETTTSYMAAAGIAWGWSNLQVGYNANFSESQLISEEAASWADNGYIFRTYSGGAAGGSFGPFSSSNPGYLGLRFDSAGGDNWNYGWLHIDAVAADCSWYHVSGYAYEDNGSPIAAGAVPEPSSIALLALGAAGIRALRRFNRPGE